MPVAFVLLIVMLLNSLWTTIVIRDAETGHVYAKIRDVISGDGTFTFYAQDENGLPYAMNAYYRAGRDTFTSHRTLRLLRTVSELKDIVLAPGEYLEVTPPNWRDLDGDASLQVVIKNYNQKTYDELEIAVEEWCMFGYQIPDWDDGYDYDYVNLAELCGAGTKILVSLN